MVEFAIVLLVNRKLVDGHGESPIGQLLNNRIVTVQSEVSETTRNSLMSVLPLIEAKSRSHVEMIDIVAIFVFVVSYVIYNCIYFALLI